MSPKEKLEFRSVTDPSKIRRLAKRCPGCGARVVMPCRECGDKKRKLQNRIVTELKQS